jgi:hypothetical protein
MKLSLLSILLGVGFAAPQIYGIVNPQKLSARHTLIAACRTKNEKF